jgi:hypothetical protein
LFPEDNTKAGIDVDARLPEYPKINNLGLAAQFLGIEIQTNENGSPMSPGQHAFISMILEQCNL